MKRETEEESDIKKDDTQENRPNGDKPMRQVATRSAGKRKWMDGHYDTGEARKDQPFKVVKKSEAVHSLSGQHDKPTATAKCW